MTASLAVEGPPKSQESTAASTSGQLNTSWLASPHRFWDRTNLALFAGVGAVRALDDTSTGHLRALGRDEILLTNRIVDNKPLFVGIEAVGTALSIGVSYWFHRTGHHTLERWTSIVHIGVGTFGDIRNYSLKRLPPQ